MDTEGASRRELERVAFGPSSTPEDAAAAREALHNLAADDAFVQGRLPAEAAPGLPPA
jgi:hypothetical protein